eukprot:GFUD01063830.1.p1 GENE.GFUD01063830.1~~GFUD01063830.1.p1  ORF type:complete len:547 (+),score=129.48 GFUD01063830.1:337-1977(+)
MLTLMMLSLVHSSHAKGLSGENVCIRQELESKMINTTYLEAVRIKKHYVCFTPPFLCAEWHNTMETRWKLENVTRLANLAECCSGYSEVSGSCQPRCSKGCLNGKCSSPETCSCKSGFSGESCETMGCPGGKWGKGCTKECSCHSGGFCHPVTGVCTCTQGYTGLQCQDKCGSGYFGVDCREVCSCDVGHSCHHVTGDCTPCTPGLYGQGCSYQCRCDQEGTELCSHKDGRCFCRGNWFGRTCELQCPFGYINNTCHTQPINNSTCQCPNDLYSCSLEFGCVCPSGQDCGVENINLNVELAPYSAKNDHATPSTAPITVSILIIALVAVILVIVFYRRRMKVMKKDLKNRSVYYSDSGSVDSARTHDLIIRDHDPLNVSNEGLTTINNITAYHSNQDDPNLLNNIRITLDSQKYPKNASDTPNNRPNPATSNMAIKNVNVENVKLGEIASCDALETDGATGTSYPNTNFDSNNSDVNIFHNDYKSNINSRYQNKAVKADLEVMIRNNLVGKKDRNPKKQKNIDDNDDDDHSKFKVDLPTSKNGSCD